MPVCPTKRRILRPKFLTVQILPVAAKKFITPIKMTPALGVNPESGSVTVARMTFENISTTLIPVNSWKIMLVILIQLHFTYF